MFGPQLLVKNLQFEDGKMIPAAKYFSAGESSSVELTDDEKKIAEEIRASKLLLLILFNLFAFQFLVITSGLLWHSPVVGRKPVWNTHCE